MARAPRLPALPWVRGGVTQGLSANQSYREYVQAAHSEGLTGLRRQDFLRLYSQTRAARGQSAAAIRYPRSQLPDDSVTSPLDTEKRTGYAHYVGIYYRTRSGGPIQSEPWLIRSQELITPEEAERRAGYYIAQSEDRYPRNIVGIGYVGTLQFNPRS